MELRIHPMIINRQISSLLTVTGLFWWKDLTEWTIVELEPTYLHK